MNKMPRPSDLMAACPNPTTALLMQHIIYCSRYAKIGRGGLRWFISSHANWATNSGLSPRQVKRSLAALRGLGLIETERHLHYGRNVTHVRVVYEGGLPEETEGGPSEETDSGPFEETDSGPFKGKDQKKDQQKDQTLRESAAGDHMKIDTPWMKGKAQKVAGVTKANDEKVKKRFSDDGLREAMDRAEACPSTGNLEKLFGIAWAAGGFGYRPPLIKKERGQLTEIVNACASTEVGVYLIVDATKNWKVLVVHLKQIMKSSQPPETPVPGYIRASIVPVLAWVTKRANETAMQALASTDGKDDGWANFD